MKGHLGAALVASTALLVLSGCAAEPSVDLDAAQDWLTQVKAEESDGPGAAGTASMRITPPGDDSGDDGVRLDFAAPTQLVRADARCFGDGTANVTVTLFDADGTSSDTFDAELPCDTEPHSIELDHPPASAALIEADGSAATYLHVTLIQELVVER